ALSAAFLDDEAPKPRAVVVEEIRGAHVTRDHDRIVRELLVGCAAAAGIRCREDALEPVREILEIAHAVTPIRIALAQHACARFILNALDGGLRSQTRLDGLLE